MRKFNSYMHNVPGVLILVSFLVATLSTTVAATEQTGEPQLETLRLQLKWLHQFQFAGYYAAIEQGYYREAGFNVVLQEHPKDRTPTDILLAGDAEYAITGSSVAVHRAEGAPLVALAAISQHSPLSLLVTEKSGITKPEDLIGKRIMLDLGVKDASIMAMLKQAGLTSDDYIRQDTSYNPLDLVEGKTDAFDAYVTDQGYQLKALGIGYHYLLPSRYGIDFYDDILVTTEQEVINHPARVERFRQATLKGWTYAMSHTDEMINLILKR